MRLASASWTRSPRGIRPADLQEYLGHPLDVIPANEIDDLRAIFAGIRMAHDVGRGHRRKRGDEPPKTAKTEAAKAASGRRWGDGERPPPSSVTPLRRSIGGDGPRHHRIPTDRARPFRRPWMSTAIRSTTSRARSSGSAGFPGTRRGIDTMLAHSFAEKFDFPRVRTSDIRTGAKTSQVWGYPAVLVRRWAGGMESLHAGGAWKAGEGPFYELIHFSVAEGDHRSTVSAGCSPTSSPERARDGVDDDWFPRSWTGSAPSLA